MKTAIVVPNWNGQDFLKDCIDSLLIQSYPSTVIVVDNGSVDDSRSIIEEYGERVVKLYNHTNMGFSGGVNCGIRYAQDNNFEAVALLNNDAVADKKWLENLVASLDETTGITTGTLQSIDGAKIDSTGEQLSEWGLPFPRGRDVLVSNKIAYVSDFIFGASGGASLYSLQMLKKIGLFDEDFFAYYEDVDISFRAQLAGWKVRYTPRAVAYHRIGETSKKIKGFTTYQTFKNLPMLLLKNVPLRLGLKIWPRFLLAYTTFFLSSIPRGHVWYALKGIFKFISLIPKKTKERRAIQANRKVSVDYIDSLLVHDLPENSTRLRALRTSWHKIRGAR